MTEYPEPDTPAESPSGTLGSASASAESGKQALEQQLAEAETKVKEQREAWLRALANTENVRKRAELDVANAHRFGAERLVGMLVPVMDSLEAALASPGAGSNALRSGVELTLKQLKSVFDKAGVTEINPSRGEKFDPHRHQAMAAVEADADPNTVVEVMQKGYALHDRVVRPALVSVAKARGG